MFDSPKMTPEAQAIIAQRESEKRRSVEIITEAQLANVDLSNIGNNELLWFDKALTNRAPDHSDYNERNVLVSQLRGMKVTPQEFRAAVEYALDHQAELVR